MFVSRKFLFACALIVGALLLGGCPNPAGDDNSALEAADAFKTAHSVALGKTVDTVTTADEGAVNAAMTALEALGADAKALLGTEKALLNSLKAKIEDLLEKPGQTANLNLRASGSLLNAFWDTLAKATAYEIYYSASDTAPNEDAGAVTSGVTFDGNSAIISSLSEATTYYVWVRGTNSNGKGLWSSGKSLATLKGGNSVLSFVIAETDGVISDDDASITLAAPYATTDFTPAVTHSEGASGGFVGAGSFPGERAYRVTAENGATRDYTVRVDQPGKSGGFTLLNPFAEPANASLGGTFVLNQGATDGTEQHVLVLNVAGASGIQWRVDNYSREGSGRLTLRAEEYTPGTHYASVEFMKDGKFYDSGLTFTVEGEE